MKHKGWPHPHPKIAGILLSLIDVGSIRHIKRLSCEIELRMMDPLYLWCW